MRPTSINLLKLPAEFCMTFHAKFARIIPPENITEFLLAMDAPDFSRDQSGETGNMFAKPKPKDPASWTKLTGINAEHADCNAALTSE